MHYLLRHQNFDHFLEAFKDLGFQTLGPTIRDHAIVYDEINSCAELPIGFTDTQSPGAYRLKKRPDHAFFGYTVSPFSWKRFLDPPRQKLFSIKRNDWVAREDADNTRPMVLIGVKACELAAIKIQDRIFLEGAFVNPVYQKRRESCLIVGVHCYEAGKSCFCASMGAGPNFQEGCDLLLTEFVEAGYFAVEAVSNKGKEFIEQLGLDKIPEDIKEKISNQLKHTTEQISRKLNAPLARNVLKHNLESPIWDEIAEQCLSCANCTLACPTCFCSTVEDTVDLTGEHAERWKNWDSCFTFSFSYINRGSVRQTTKSRYRQWLTHKLSNWYEQFDTSGCVGCGRCITWCPVGIDFIEIIPLFEKEAKT
jgi:ferredoxin